MLDRLQHRAGAITVGDPFDERTDIGALISPDHLRKVEAFVDSGVKAGAEVVVGGHQIGAAGASFYEPTIFFGVQPSMSIVRDEIFARCSRFYRSIRRTRRCPWRTTRSTGCRRSVDPRS